MDPQNTPERPEIVTPPVAVDDAQLSPAAWVARNGPALLLMIGGISALLYFKGVETFLSILMVGLGLGLVIFIHELGHFLVAKWCDVHVQTFSIGFGPALPGCSFTRGETTYKIALFPLGGYVKMVGEGDEGTEEDEGPRSFKNKTVGQRMAIISAGVVMNVILGFLAFILAFKSGVSQTAPVISILEAGGPAWRKAVRSGAVVEQVEGVTNPYFDDVKMRVMLSDEGDELTFVLRPPEEEPRTVRIAPRKLPGDPNPVIGVLWPMELKLPSARRLGGQKVPARPHSAAAVARALDLQKGDRVLATTDPERPDSAELKPLEPAGDFLALGERLRRLEDKPMTLQVRRASGAEETVRAEPVGFLPEDVILATSTTGDEPFAVEPLPLDPRDPQGRHRDIFELQRRLMRLVDRPVVLQVKRKGGETANVLLPVEYHKGLAGVAMRIGEVVAVREGSSAAEKGVREAGRKGDKTVHGDILTHVLLRDRRGESKRFALREPDPKNPEERNDEQVNPLRLRDALRRWAEGRTGVTADLTVRREEAGNKEETLAGLAWDDSWRFNLELPLGRANAAASVPELGLAFQVTATVDSVRPGSAAQEKGLRREDALLAVWFAREPKKPGDDKWAKKPDVDLVAKNNPNPVAPRWAQVDYMLQAATVPEVKLKVQHTGGEEVEVELPLTPDTTWPVHDPQYPRGLLLVISQDRIAQADSLAAAMQMGLRHTYRTIISIYESLKSLVTRRVDFGDSVQGPIGIALLSYETANKSWADLALIIGIISINLAVVNFLPIPVLDGGHMVFLIYEKLRGKPASETVRAAATWCGLLLLLSLMAFVIYLDVVKYIL